MPTDEEIAAQKAAQKAEDVMKFGFRTQKEFDDFQNSERGKIREQEERKVKDTIEKLREDKKEISKKGDSSMDKAEVAEIVKNAVEAAVTQAVSAVTETNDKRFQEMSENVTTGFKATKRERLVDLIADQQAKYGDELMEEFMDDKLKSENITGDESPDEIRQMFKKANTNYNKYVKPLKEATKELTDEEKKAAALEDKKTVKTAPSAKTTEDPAAPAITTSSNTGIPPSLDNQSERQKAISELKKINPIKDHKKYAEAREKWKDILGN